MPWSFHLDFDHAKWKIYQSLFTYSAVCRLTVTALFSCRTSLQFIFCKLWKRRPSCTSQHCNGDVLKPSSLSLTKLDQHAELPQKPQLSLCQTRSYDISSHHGKWCVCINSVTYCFVFKYEKKKSCDKLPWDAAEIHKTALSSAVSHDWCFDIVLFIYIRRQYLIVKSNNELLRCACGIDSTHKTRAWRERRFFFFFPASGRWRWKTLVGCCLFGSVAQFIMQTPGLYADDKETCECCILFLEISLQITSQQFHRHLLKVLFCTILFEKCSIFNNWFTLFHHWL